MMKSQAFGYIRVSSKDQNIDRQLSVIKDLVSDERNIFIDKQSGKDFNRPEYELLKRVIRTGDTLIIKELDRFGRNKEEIKNEWQWFADNNITIKVLDMPILDTSEKQTEIQQLVSNIVLELLSYMAEKERIEIKKRQKEGIAIAKGRGVRFGRPPAEMPMNFGYYFMQLDKYRITATGMMKALNLKPNSFYKLLKQHLGDDKYEKWKNSRYHYKKRKK